MFPKIKKGLGFLSCGPQVTTQITAVFSWGVLPHVPTVNSFYACTRTYTPPVTERLWWVFKKKET